ncbi:hypothetical protein SCA03_30810 [Streptomyces cacaoi]|uniref:Uncharacterized protein n=1 Tax=Streptomyces cacaoi TaxID=1898 RepID=A0A4Y3R3H9_STRCI|nr:hypothetical protein SCA03_30810 [Streptomyces cacaoi]
MTATAHSTTDTSNRFRTRALRLLPGVPAPEPPLPEATDAVTGDVPPTTGPVGSAGAPASGAAAEATAEPPSDRPSPAASPEPAAAAQPGAVPTPGPPPSDDAVPADTASGEPSFRPGATPAGRAPAPCPEPSPSLAPPAGPAAPTGPVAPTVPPVPAVAVAGGTSGFRSRFFRTRARNLVPPAPVGPGGTVLRVWQETDPPGPAPCALPVGLDDRPLQRAREAGVKPLPGHAKE